MRITRPPFETLTGVPSAALKSSPEWGEREREVHRHIADFTLFMVGIFPEYLQRIKSRQLIHHTDFLIDYVKVGKQSYRNRCPDPLDISSSTRQSDELNGSMQRMVSSQYPLSFR